MLRILRRFVDFDRFVDCAPLLSVRHRDRAYRIISVCLILTFGIFSASAYAKNNEDIISRWNDLALAVIYNARMQNFSEMAFAITLMNVAIFDSINSIERRYDAYALMESVEPSASKEAAATEAAFTVLSALFQSQISIIANEKSSQLSEVPDGYGKTIGMSLGEKVARRLLIDRRDGLDTPPDAWRPETPVGMYIPTARLVTSYLGNSRPWLLKRGDQFRPPSPPLLTSLEFARDYDEVRIMGRRVSNERSKAQSFSARFWTMSGVHVWNRALNQALQYRSLTLSEHARVRALLNMAVADSYIAAWDAKFAYGFWRPVTAIRSGDRVEGAKLSREAAWRPLIETPLHPDYPSGHSANAGAAVAVLESVFGDAPLGSLSIISDDFPQAVLTFKSFEELKENITNARIYGGIHFRFSCVAGEKLGREVGGFGVENYLRQIHR